MPGAGPYTLPPDVDRVIAAARKLAARTASVRDGILVAYVADELLAELTDALADLDASGAYR